MAVVGDGEQHDVGLLAGVGVGGPGDGAGTLDAGEALGDLGRFSAAREPSTTSWPARAKR
ncbi:MAG: hypothetical protein ACPF9W_03780 [Nocardioides sp.]